MVIFPLAHRCRPWILLFALFNSTLVTATGFTVDLIYSGNLDGELEPCGCSEAGNLGGLKRHATLVDQLREADPNAVSISSGGLITAFTPDEKLKARFILEGVEALSYDAVGVQWADLAFGEPFLEGHKIPWVTTNLKGQLFAAAQVIARGEANIAVFSWLDPDESPMAAMHFGKDRLSDDAAAMVAALHQAKREGQITVLLSTLPLARARELFDLAAVDILFVKSAYEKFADPILEQGTLVLQPGSRGMRLGQVTIQFNDARRIDSFDHEVHLMPPSMADSSRMAGWYERYNAEVKQTYEESVKQRAVIDAGTAQYVGAEGCAACHASQYAVWESTKHSAAFDVLMDVNKAFDPACIKCHTVGFNEDGGFIDQLLTKHLSHVQCENCHGAGRDHVNSGGQKPVAKAGWSKDQVCGQCHVQKHSPEFRLEEYWPRIAH